MDVQGKKGQLILFIFHAHGLQLRELRLEVAKGPMGVEVDTHYQQIVGQFGRVAKTDHIRGGGSGKENQSEEDGEPSLRSGKGEPYQCGK